MSFDFLNTPITYLKGVGPKRAEVLKKEVGINTFNHLLNYFPFRYIDKSKFYKVNEIKSDVSYVQLKGKIIGYQEIGQGRTKRAVAYLRDETGDLELVWFKGIKWLKDKFKSGEEYIVFGKPTNYKGKYNIPHPEIDVFTEENKEIEGKLYPFYSSTEKLGSQGMGSKGISKLTKSLIQASIKSIPETLTVDIINDLKLIPREVAYKNIHFPDNSELLNKARIRLKFEELFFIQLQILKIKQNRTLKVKGNNFSKVGDYVNDFYSKKLPFELTDAQKRVIKEIRKDIGTGGQMNRLLQGDVGSGKTLVALMCMLIALDNGFQAALMAPTEILAQQHFTTLTQMLEGLDININLLTGSTKVAKRRIIHEQLLSGELQILIGTHALIEDIVQFKSLGFVVIDEQHRFGVEQRAKLWKKNTIPPHVLVMTATPIPRTLAMTLYGDLDYSVIDELPPGRKAVKTLHSFDSKRLRLFKFIKDQIEQGRQIYIVYPLINESETLDLKDLQDGYESIIREFPLPKYAVSILHGKMKPDAKEIEMQRFVKGETNILVSTTVIEVGVDVPNASVMIIENAERFGLSQLHQLRGRVGRGADQSYCILMTSYKLTSDAKTRINTMVKSSDGFEIAEVDLRLRGPGDMQGTQQSGVLDLKIADIIKDEKILKYARSLAMKILDDDPNLQKEENSRLAKNLKFIESIKGNWGMIS
ncbi:MAG: ATP-dependent DNA helicase RecG [Saprospiraceae bacterium]|nr:ATP-dependent DNA helicase RecG [Saprospiraceae bacterium]